MKIERLLLLLIFIIIFVIIYEFTKINILKKCPKPIIEYKYITRSFNEEQNEPLLLDNIFNKMFANPSPWMMSRGIGINDRRDTNLKNRIV